MKDAYKPEKYIWSEKDFESMCWHDCYILALGLEKHNLLLDIDYILKWVHPEGKGGPFRFWISPATLIFRDVRNFSIDISIDSWCFDGHEIEIDEVVRDDPQEFSISASAKKTDWKWTIYTNQGGIVFRSVSYRQYLRREPILSKRQRLGLEARGGISLSTDTGR